MQQDNQDTGDSQNPISDQVSQQLADLQSAGSSQVPGAQFTPSLTADDPVTEEAEAPETPAVEEEEPTAVDADAPKPYNPPAPDETPSESGPPTMAPTADVTDFSAMPEPEDGDEEEATKEDAPAARSKADSTTPSLPAELEDIKKQALAELEPLVDKLELAPEKRYNILMEIIQSSERRELLDKALDAAKNIADDNLRAQALMEVLTEVDYFGQKK